MSNIAFQAELTTAGTVLSGSNVLFDSVIFTNGNISYAPLTGIVTISDPGRYVIDWWVAQQASQSTNGAVFSLETSDTLVINGASPIKTDEVSGIAVFEFIEAPVTLSIVNNGTNTAFYNTLVPTKASLRIIEDDEVNAGVTAIIPFASGAPIIMTSIAGGAVGIPSMIGFGNGELALSNLTPTINIQGINSMAFSVPRDGTITAIAAYFSTTAALALLDSTVTVLVQLYESTTPDDNFSLIVGSDVTLAPPLTGLLVPAGTVSSGLVTGLSLPVTAGSRLLLVYSITSTGVTLINTVSGVASAGVSIA